MYFKNQKTHLKLNETEYFDYDKYGNVIVKEKSLNYRKYSPKCKVFTTAEIQEYIKNQKTGA